MGACNQREEGLKFYSGVVTRRHSFGKSVLTTLYSKMVRFLQNARLRVSQETDKKMPKNMYFRALIKSGIR